MTSEHFSKGELMKFKLADIIVLCIIVVMAAAAVGVSLHSARESGVSTLPAQIVEDTFGEAKPDQVIPMRSPVGSNTIEVIEIMDKKVYDGGPIAFVDYSVDKTFGDCVAVKYPEGRFIDCRHEKWQAMFLRAVPAGTQLPDIVVGWDSTYAPQNWR
jgi:hypothetical protein